MALAHDPDAPKKPRPDEGARPPAAGRQPDPSARPEIPPPESAPESVMESPPPSEQMQG